MSDLGAFLRARREELQPSAVGLPDSGRRRTPGLRREEVATLAGVSVDYLVRLEQGRDSKPSPSVLGALADALHLDHDERTYLVRLAAQEHAPELCSSGSPRTHEVAGTVRRLLHELDPTPAFVLDPSSDVLAANRAWSELVGPMGLSVGTNLARFVFTEPAARRTYLDWEQVADDQVRQLRSAHAGLVEDRRHAALIEELMAEPEFASRWTAHGVGPKRRTTKRLRHPGCGELRFDVEVLEVAEAGQRLVTWLAADEATVTATGPTSPPHLEAI